MTHWIPQQLHISEVMFSLYLLARQQLENAAQNLIFLGMFFAKTAIVKTTKGKD